MSDYHTSSSTEAAEQPIPGLLLFAPSAETSKPPGDFPTATRFIYEIYLHLWWARNERYNTIIASCNYLYNTLGESDDDFLQLITTSIPMAHQSMMEDFEAMEEKLRLGTIEDEAGDLAGVGGIHTVEVPEEPGSHADREVVIDVEDEHIFSGRN